MSLSEQIGEVYSSIENKFYSGMDFLHDHGVPVYSIIDPLEERGIPAFPTSIALVIGLAFLLYGLLFLSIAETNITFSIKDNYGASLSGVSVNLFNEAGGKIELGSTSFQNNQTVKVPTSIGSTIKIKAKKTGYEETTKDISISKENLSVSLQLTKIIAYMQGGIRLIDSETDDLIEGAKVTAILSSEAVVDCYEETKGIYTCNGVVLDEETQLIIEHPNYEQKQFTTTFASGDMNEISLVPKAEAMQGKTNFIVRTYNRETNERIGNFTLKIFDSKTNELITEITETDSDGEQVEKISKGTSIRFVIKKEDYITYDSSTVEENLTLRDDEVLKEIYLKEGTNALTVGVIDVSGTPLTEIPVYLFNALGEIINEKTTSLAGEVIFENLNADEIYYVSAWQDKFIPVREEINLAEKNNINLVFKRATASNSGSLMVYTVAEDSSAMNDVTLNFFEEKEGKESIPLGIPPQKTDITGKYSTLAPLNSTVVVNATKDLLVGEAKVKIIETFKNEAFITLTPPFSQVTLKIVDENGEEISSNDFVTIIAGENVLFEGEYAEGGIIFNPEGNKYVSVSVTDAEGEVFEEEVYIEGLEEVTVSPKGKTTVSTTPEVEFMGIFDVEGNEANGIAKGIDYFLKFRIVYPEGNNQNGLHVRLGENSVRFVDSQDAGIIGFSATGASVFYGRSYSPEPSPGFEALDFDNQGEEGKYNKFTELYFDSGGEKIIKIRVKAKETANAPDVLLNYRAWSKIGNTIYRTPVDEELTTEEYSNNKTSLYAKTNVERIKILEASATCKNDLCASYKFIRSDGSEYQVDNFEAIVGELYALEVNLSPPENTTATVKASTSKVKPKLGFQGFTINDYTNFPDTNSPDTSIQVENISTIEGENTSVRLFFKANTKENSGITLQIVSGDKIINEQFYFDIYNEQIISMKTIPEIVSLGENFIMVLTTESGESIEEAEIILENNSGEHLETITGNKTVNKGGNGRYSIKNSFTLGTLQYEIKANRFKPLKGTIELTKDDVLSWAEEETFLAIKKQQQSAEKYLELINNSKQTLQDLIFEIEPIGNLPSGLEINVTPLSGLGPNAKQRVVLVAEYTGERETEHGEARIIAKARTETGFSVIAETKVTIDYNPLLSADCIEFSKNKLAVYVASGLEDRDYYDATYGGLSAKEPTKYYNYSDFSTTTSTSFTAKLSDSAECHGFEIELIPEAIMRGTKDTGLEVEAENIRLSPQLTETEGRRTDTDEITITVTNKIIRNYSGKQKFKFDVLFKGDGFEKSLPLEVYVWNPRYALQVNRNIELYLGPDDKGKYSAQVPLFVRNVGEADIENVQFRVSSATSRGNVNLTIVPNISIQFLQKGQEILPPKTLVAQLLRNEKTTLNEVKELDITGVIDGHTFSFGPIIVTVHASGDQCLIAVPGNVNFTSTKSSEGAISKEIRLRNTCAEEVRIIDLTESPLGNNRLSLSSGNAIIPPGSEATVNLVLEKRENYTGSPVPVYVNAFLPRSGTPIQSSPIIVDVKLGKEVAIGKAATETQEIDICGKTDTKTVRFPIIATGTSPSCDNAYCDAEQLAEYLMERVSIKIKEAEKQINNYGSVVQPANCSNENMVKGFCTFTGLGLTQETFYVYMQNDNLTPELMQKKLEGKTTSAKNYTVDYLETENAGEYLGGYSKQVFVNSNIRGCGRYSVTLNGSVRVQNGNLLPDLMNISMDVTSGEDNSLVRQVTEQCTAKIQNIGNFLPIDKGLTPKQKIGSWLGVVETKEKGLENLAKDVAKNVFGNEDRATTSAGVSKIKLAFGNDEGYIVKVDMDKVDSESPKTITAYIRESIGTDEELQKAIAKEASQAIADLRENVIDGCIAEDESYFLLKSAKDIGKIQLTAEPTINVLFDSYNCTAINVSSNIKDKILLEARKEGEYDGIEDNIIFRNETNEEIIELNLEKIDEKTKRYVAEAQVCVKGNSNFAQLGEDKKIIVTAQRSEGEGKKPEEAIITLKVCGIHPLTFLEKTADMKNKGKYYATFIWKGDPEEIKLSELMKINNVQTALNNAEKIISNEREITPQDTPKVVDAKTKAGYAYLGTCAGVSTLTSAVRPTLGIPGWIFNVLMDCGLPYAALMGKSIPMLEKGVEFVQEFVGSIIGKVMDGIKYVANGLGTMGKLLFKALGVQSLDETSELAKQAGKIDITSTSEKLTEAFALTSLTKDALYARSLSFAKEGKLYKAMTTSKATMIGESLIDDVISDVHKNAFNGSTDASVKNFLKEYKSSLRKNWKTTIKSVAKNEGKRGILAMEQIESALQTTVDKAVTENDVLTKFGASRTHIAPSSALSAFDKDKFATELVDEIRGKAGISATATPEVTRSASLANAPTPANAAKRVKDVSDGLIDDAIRKIQKETGATLDTTFVKRLRNTYKLNPTVTEVPGQLPTTGTPKKTWNIVASEATQKKMLGEIEEEIMERVEKSALGTANEFSTLTTKKFAEKAADTIGATAKAKIKPNAVRMLTWGNSLRFIKNLLKEGAIGLAAHYTGLKAYDFFLEKNLAKLNNTPKLDSAVASEERGIMKLPELIIENGNTEILKYRTYEIQNFIETEGFQRLIFERIEQVPKGIDKSLVIEDCENPGFKEELAGLPGLIPKLENESDFPELFKGSKIKNLQHVNIAKNYLGKQEKTNERYGELINEAIEERETEFNAKETGLNLEALVTTIGIVKSGLGTDKEHGASFMFRCDAQNQTKHNVYNNALCATNKLVSYAGTCKTEPYCYLTEYNKDKENDPANLIRVTPEQYLDLYGKWASYAWETA